MRHFLSNRSGVSGAGLTAAMCSGDLDAVLRWRMRFGGGIRFGCGVAVEDAVGGRGMRCCGGGCGIVVASDAVCGGGCGLEVGCGARFGVILKVGGARCEVWAGLGETDHQSLGLLRWGKSVQGSRS